MKSFPSCDAGFFVERSGQKKSTCVASKVGNILAEPMGSNPPPSSGESVSPGPADAVGRSRGSGAGLIKAAIARAERLS